MLTALALVFLAGLLLGEAARRMGLPRIVGMLAAGILLGPCGLDLLDAALLTLSPDLRRMALVIILLKAGLALDPRDLRAVGRPALCMAFLPALCELLAYTVLAPLFFGVTHTEAALIQSVSVLIGVECFMAVFRSHNHLKQKLNHEPRHEPVSLPTLATLSRVYAKVCRANARCRHSQH